MRQVTMADAPVNPSEPVVVVVVVDDHVATHGSRRILNRSIPFQEGKVCHDKRAHTRSIYTYL